MDGSIVIGTGLDTSNLEKELDRLEKQLHNKQIDLNITNIDYESAERKLNNINRELEENLKKEEDIKKQIEEQKKLRDEIIASGGNQLKVYQLNEGINKLYEELDPVQSKTIELTDKWLQQNDVLTKIGIKQEEQKNDISEIEQKIVDVYARANDIRKLDLSSSLKQINSGVEKIGRKISRLWLSMIGIHSIYGAISSSVSRITNKNEELKGKIESIRNAIDNIVVKLIEWAFPIIEKIIQYIGAVIKKLFGIDIFKKSLSSGKKLNKLITKFDEMNVLENKNKESDYSIQPLPEDELPGWLQWILDHGDEIKEKLTGIGVGLGAVALGFSPLKALGLGLIVDGILDLKDAIDEFIEDPNVDNFGRILKDIGEIIAGAGLLLGSPGLTLTGVGIMIVGAFIIYYDEICDFLDKADEKVGEWMGKIREKLGPLANILIGPIEAVVKFAKNLYKRFYGGIRKWIDGIIKIFNGDLVGGIEDVVVGIIETIFSVPLALWDMFKETPIGKWVNEHIVQPIKEKLEPIYNWIKEHVVNPIVELFGGKSVGQGIKTGFLGIGGLLITKLFGTNKDNEDAMGDLEDTVIEGVASVKGQSAGILKGMPDAVQNDLNETTKIFASFPDSIKNKLIDPTTGKLKTFGTTVAQGTAGAFDTVFNKVIAGVETSMNKAIDSVNSYIRTANFVFKSFGLNLKEIPRVNFPRLKLAKGGIINQPGRGVPVGYNGVAGERGREGILPLSDSRQMSLLGEEIAKNVVINLTNVTELDGRTIARNVVKVINDTNFASNGGAY